MRERSSIINQERIPKPAELVNTREQSPFPLFGNHPNWIGGERRERLKTGGYIVEGMAKLLCLE